MAPKPKDMMTDNDSPGPTKGQEKIEQKPGESAKKKIKSKPGVFSPPQETGNQDARQQLTGEAEPPRDNIRSAAKK